MKIKLNIGLDIGNQFNDFSQEEIAQIIFDEYINYVVCSHNEDALKWMTNNSAIADLLVAHHQTWADIAKNANWSFEKN